jgi:hypothetical protein
MAVDIALPVLLLAHIPVFFGSREAWTRDVAG